MADQKNAESCIGKIAAFIDAEPGWQVLFFKKKDGKIVEDLEGGRSTVYRSDITRWALVPTITGGLFDFMAPNASMVVKIVPCDRDGVVDDEHGYSVLVVVPPTGTVDAALEKIREVEARIAGTTTTERTK